MNKFFYLKTSFLGLIFFFLFFPFFTLSQSLTPSELSVLQSKISFIQSQIQILRNQIFSLQKTYFKERDCVQLHISWEKIRYAQGYRLYRNGVIVYQGRDNNFFDSGLTPNKRYSYVVYGLINGKQGQPSEIKEIITPNVCTPLPPQLNLQESSCGGNIALTWAANSSAKVYQLFRNNRKVYQGPLNYFLDSNLFPNKTYQYKIRAGNESGWGEFSKNFYFTSSNVCGSSGLRVSSLLSESQREGILSLNMNYSRNKVIRTFKYNSAIMSFNAKADFSDIVIRRIDIFFDKRPWLYLDKIWLTFEGKTLALKDASKESSFTEITRGGLYQLRFDQLNALIKEGRKGTFQIVVKVKDRPIGALPVEITAFLNNNSIRGIDSLNIHHFAPLSGGGKEGIFSRVFKIEQFRYY